MDPTFVSLIGVGLLALAALVYMRKRWEGDKAPVAVTGRRGFRWLKQSKRELSDC